MKEIKLAGLDTSIFYEKLLYNFSSSGLHSIKIFPNPSGFNVISMVVDSAKARGYLLVHFPFSIHAAFGFCKTLESLPKLLPGRKHIVLTSRNLDLDPAILVVHSIDELLEVVHEYPEVMVIGGASIYKQMLDYSDKLILTEIDAEADADVYFPSFDKSEWNREVVGEHEEDDVSYKHLVYTRKKR